MEEVDEKLVNRNRTLSTNLANELIIESNLAAHKLKLRLKRKARPPEEQEQLLFIYMQWAQWAKTILSILQIDCPDSGGRPKSDDRPDPTSDHRTLIRTLDLLSEKARELRVEELRHIQVVLYEHAKKASLL